MLAIGEIESLQQKIQGIVHILMETISVNLKEIG
jgi:hypothetical protein